MIKLLLVDDEKIIREGISNTVDWEKLNIKISTASNGLEAYEMICSEPPDILITDIKMPGLNGLELIEKVKLSFPDVIFVILSAHGEFSFASKAMEYGVKYYILKPTSEEEIIKTLEKVIMEHKYRATSLVRIPFEFDKISTLVKIGDKDETKKEIEQIFAILINNRLDHKTCKTYCTELFMNIVRQSKTDKVNDYLRQSIEVEQSGNLEQLYKFILEVGMEITQSKEEENKQKHGRIVCEIVKCVENNISNEDLSLSWIANNHLYMNVDYISKIFKKEMKENFSQFLTQMRVNKAKSIIERDRECKMSNIADMIGYGSNPQYFSQVFKKYTGYTPKEYRELFYNL